MGTMKLPKSLIPLKRSCINDYLMDIHQDRFIHFTTQTRADEIIESGVLLMHPPYKKFGIDAVCAVSLVWGTYVPNTQHTHIKGLNLAAVLFKTNTIPEYGYVEEVVWKQDVRLIQPTLIDPRRAIKMLSKRSHISDDSAVYYILPTWCR